MVLLWKCETSVVTVFFLNFPTAFCVRMHTDSLLSFCLLMLYCCVHSILISYLCVFVCVLMWEDISFLIIFFFFPWCPRNR